MNRIAAFLSLALLAACAGSGFRDQGAAITSMAVFDPARFAGHWYDVAHFPAADGNGCTDVQLDYADMGAGALSLRQVCFQGGALKVGKGQARISGPGRMSVAFDGGLIAQEHWVLWVDHGYRTAVIGMPSGKGGWILNRTPEIPADRLAAAREVLSFNGYDLNQLLLTDQGGS